MADKTLFEKIIAREIPAQIVYEDDHCVGFRDINPQAPTHVLVVPRKPIRGIGSAGDEDREVLGRVLLAAAEVARQQGLGRGYRLVINEGADAGQTVSHLHVHVIGGKPLGWPPFPG
ncbi:MAG TPA: histidine triad nucleotide-binding protein [Candidatus Binatia bacterium]|nr:histidine triad nucleotide-binding protein [Candidatus Binatia bacterium]